MQILTMLLFVELRWNGGVVWKSVDYIAISASKKNKNKLVPIVLEFNTGELLDKIRYLIREVEAIETHVICAHARYTPRT